MVPKRSYSYLKDNLDDQVQNKNTNVCVRREITPFVGINILSTQMTWILLTQVQEIWLDFGSEFTLMSGFGTMEMWSYGIWAYSLLSIIKYLSLTFWSRHGDKFVHRMTLLRDISLRWGAVCPLLYNMNTWFFHRSSFPVIIYFYMLLMKIMLLFWYRPLQRVQIHQRLICHIIRCFILLEMIFWS